ncbi:glycosyltransferase family 39 protein [Candidatus Daviesbacteria bacterium]|nr:glycosyltransferase family 39 protein [Candidatus Daviesbacteria bacterium]
MKFKIIFALASVLLIASVLRFFFLDQLPPGLNTDEASQGYDAYSLLLTGKDQWGKSFPIFLRSFGSYQSPLYTYLTIIPTFFWDISIFSTRFISALSGVSIVFLTFLIIRKIEDRANIEISLISSLMVAISPWAIFFSRNATEANLALAIFLGAVYLLLLSLKNINFLPLSFLLLGISTYAYHAQRVITLIFIAFCFFAFRRYFFKKQILFVVSVAIFLVIQIPQFLLINTPGANRRLEQVNYFKQAKGSVVDKSIFIVRKFSAQYSAYLSPNNLFFNPDPQGVRSIPQMSVFYSFMIIPFLFGIKEILKRWIDPLVKILLFAGLISLVPSAFTGEPFYTMRVLPYLWVISLVIGFGGYSILNLLRQKVVKVLALVLLLGFSIPCFYINYFIFLKYERADYYEYPFVEVAKESERLKDEQFVVDTGREPQLYILFAFYKKYDPKKFQEENGLQNIADYYYQTELSKKHTVGNVELKPIDWKDASTEKILVGDEVAISDPQVKDHNLMLLKEFKDLEGEMAVRAFKSSF